MLFSELRKHQVITPLGKRIGYAHDIVIDTTTWEVKELTVSKWLKKSQYKLESIKRVAKGKKLLLQEDAVSHVPEKSSLHHMSGRDLMRKRVFSKDEKHVGYIYDIDLATKLTPWMVEKVLVYHGLTKRRLRLSPSDILSITEKVILSRPHDKL